VRKAEWRQIDFNKALWTMLRCAALRCAPPTLTSC
jgi:hypothetical protein